MTISLTPSEKRRCLDLVRSFKEAHVLIIGDFILDQFIWGSVDRISPEAPVPVVNIQRESYMPGGSLNVANNVHTLGGTVYPCGVLGRDAWGRMLLKAIRREGIDTGGILYDTHRPTSVKARVIAHSQQVVRFDREKAEDISGQLRARIMRFVSHQMPSVDVVVIEDYGKGVVTTALVKQIVRLAKKFRKPVFVDPKERHFPQYVGVTAITPNCREAFGALNLPIEDHKLPITEVGERLMKRLKCQAVLMTLGEDGMMLFERGAAVTKIPTAAREVFDVSGAGDTVVAVFSLAVAVGAKMKEAAILSNLAAGIVVGKLGTATVSPQELVRAVESCTSANTNPRAGRKR